MCGIEVSVSPRFSIASIYVELDILRYVLFNDG